MAARHGKLLQSLNVTERELCAVSKRLRFLRGDVTAKRPERSEKRTEPVAWWHLGRDARQNLGHLDPAPLFRRLTRRDSHGEGDNAVLASDGRIGLRAGLDGVDEGKSLGLVSGDIPAHEKIVRQVGHAHKVLGECARRVGIHVVCHHHCLGAERLGALVVAICGLAADIDHGGAAARVLHYNGGSVVGLRTRQIRDRLRIHGKMSARSKMAPRFCRCAQAGRRARLYSLACHLLDRSCRSQQRRSPRGPHPSGSETCRGHGLPCP
mmetsp:Transcript_29832/g.91559  ORF Transcript_29832/g.91559 Transcript_29832/m.91559 type:complete len:266 (+) Transcript_29832:551-1348(+)